MAAGHLSDDDAEEIERADLVCSGRDPQSREPLRVVVEVSARVELYDVERSATRAALLGRLGTPAIAVVVGQRLDRDAEQQAGVLGVRTVIDPDA